MFAVGRAFFSNCGRRNRRSTLQPSEEARFSAAIAAPTIWEVAKGRELDPEVPPRPQQPWRTRCPRLCESGAAMREEGWWSPRREAAAQSLPAACCSPWTPRCGVPPSRAHARMLRAETGGEDDGGSGARPCQPLAWPRPGPQTWRKDFSFKALLRTRHTLL